MKHFYILTIYVSFNPLQTHSAVSHFNVDLSRFAQWSDLNNLVLNPSKSKFLILGARHQIEHQVGRVSVARNLGVLMDGFLRFGEHIFEQQ